MSLDDFSNVVVTTGSAALSQVGFGTLLLACGHNYWADLSKEFTSVDGLVELGVPTDAPMYLMAEAAFAQRPKLKKVKIGKLTTRPTQTITITPVASVGTNYAISLAVDDRAPIAFSVASGTVDQVCDLLEAAINAAALDEVTVTPTGGATATALVLTVSAGHVLTFFGWAVTHMAVVDSTPGQTIRLTPSALNSTVYSVDLYCQGGAPATAEYTSDASASVDEICDGLQAAIHALGMPGVTVVPSGGTATYIDVLMTSGRLLFLAGWDDSRLAVEDRTQDPGIAADLAAIRLADSDWYGLAIDCNANDVIEEAADWAETQLLLFGYNNSDTLTGDASGHTTGIFYVLKGKSYGRSIGKANFNDTGAFGGVRMLAERFPHDPGAAEAGGVFAFKTLRGETADLLTSTQKTTLRADNAVVYESTAGVSHTLDGKVAGGEYADVVRFLDWFTIRLQERIASVQLSNQRVHYTARGLSMIETACRAQLSAGLRAGGIADSDDEGNPPNVEVPLLADTDPVDRAARTLRNVTISFRLAGAIQLVDPINVTASV